MKFEQIQHYMRSRQIDGWLIHDFRNSNGTLARLLPPPAGVEKRHVTRRLFLFIPATGAPTLVTSAIDARAFPDVPAGMAARETFISWEEYRAALTKFAGGKRIAMEYAPGCALPVVSVIDAGTIELIRTCGAEVISSADLIQVAVAQWGAEAVREHARASALVDAAKNDAFAHIAAAHRAGKPIHEHEVAQFIRDRFKAGGVQWPDGPIVAVNEHAADPHYEPSDKHPQLIKPGDWVLIDLWARIPGDANIHSDITWTGYCGNQVPKRHLEVFNTVRAARDASLALAQAEWKAGRPVQGWQLDDAARHLIEKAGFGAGIRHRTGHSLSPGPMVHGTGMNLDNLETHDTRQMLPGTGFTIEPGIYLPDERIGVRNEINVYVDEKQGPVVTSKSQNEPILIV